MSAGRNGERLRILVCLLYYVPNRSGLTVYTQRIAEGLAARGHEVTVLTSRFARSLPHGTRMENGVRVVRLRTLPWAISRGMVMPFWPWAALKMARQHDLFWANFPMLEMAPLAVVSRLSGRAIVATQHGDLILPAGRFNRFIAAMMYRNFRFMAARTAQLVAISEDYARHSRWLSSFHDRVTVISPPIEMPHPERERSAALRAQWAPDGGPVIGHAGRVVEEKRPDLLLKAFEVIKQRFPHARIVFAGNHDVFYENFLNRHRALLQRFAGQVLFLGKLPDAQAMANFFAACDVLALASDSESFGLVQVEAMLSGTPVVTTDTPGGRVPVQRSGMGLLAKPGDWRSFGAALLRVLGDLPGYTRPRAEIEALFPYADTIERYERLFRRYARR